MIKKGSHGEIVSKEMKEMNAALTRSSEVKTIKMSPVECIKNGVSIDKARDMHISELTREDAEYLLNNGVSKHGLSKLYNAKDGSMYPKLTKWGLHHPGAAMSAKQRMDAYENDKPVLQPDVPPGMHQVLPVPKPPDTIECPRCHANYKRVEMINTHDRGPLCMRCYDENYKPAITVTPTINASEDMTAEELREAIDEAAAKIMGVDITDSPCAPSEALPEPVMHGDIKDTGIRTEFDTGAVRDLHEGKGRYDLLPWDAIHELALHCEQGALKYGERNCEKGIPVHSLIDSAVRHLSSYLRGENDEKHLRAAVWNICFAIYMEKNLPEMQDIPVRQVHKS